MYEGKKDAKTKDESLGLHSAAMNGNVGLVKFALDNGAVIDSVVNGYMPLQLACINENHIAVVQYLIDRGADVNAQRWSKKHVVDKSQAVAGATGSTALHVACANGCTKIVDLLLRNGAKINVKDKYGSKPIDVASAKGQEDIVKLLDTFGSMQQMLKGLQENTKHVQLKKEIKEKLRRPSLPSVLESHKLDIPDVSTLPLPRHSLNSVRPSKDELNLIRPPKRYQNYFQSSSTEKQDYYSHGVVNQYQDENYLASLERRAYGITSPTSSPTSCFESVDLKRCNSSDIGHLRTTALMNAMAANNINLQDDEFGNIIQVDDDDDEEEAPFDEAATRHSFDQVVKKSSWFSNHSDNSKKSIDISRKSIDIYPVGRPSLENSRRSSLDFRPSLDTLSHLAKKSIEGLSRKSIDIDPDIDSSSKRSFAAKGFLSKWWSNSSTTANTEEPKEIE